MSIRQEIYVVTLPPPMIQYAERCLLSTESEKARVKTCCIVLNNKHNDRKTINKQIKERAIRFLPFILLPFLVR